MLYVLFLRGLASLFFFIAIVFIKKRTKNIREIKTSFLHGGEKSNHHLCFEDDDDE